MRRILALLAGSALLWPQQIPSPRDHFGFTPGEDRRLLDWTSIESYFRKLDEASDSVAVERLGTTTGGRSFLAVTVSGRPPEEWPAVLEMQRRLALGEPGAREDAWAAGHPVVVFVQATLHSTEVGGSLMLPGLVHRLLGRTDPGAARILRNVHLVVVPSANPDGLDLVADWYRRTLDTPWEGSNPPELYHRYAGHDNNRDWVAQNLVETQLVSSLLYSRLRPTIVLDVHQMGSRGARIFVPPFSDPLNPNLPALLSRQIDLAGHHMALALTAAGRTGVVQDVTFDNYWTGGARNVPVRHNMIGLLTETASARLASPLTIPFGELTGHGHGLPEYRRQGNFPEPWLGGTWRLADILSCMETSTWALLDFASRYREDLAANLASLARTQIELGTSQPPYGWVVPSDQPRVAAAGRLLEVLARGGVRTLRLEAETVIDGRLHPAGSVVVPAAQPWRAFAKDVLEVQEYPVLRAALRGEILRPYDASAWSLPALFGLEVVPVGSPLPALPEAQVGALRLPAPILPDGSAWEWSGLDGAAHALANALCRAGVAVERRRGGGGPRFRCQAGAEHRELAAQSGVAISVPSARDEGFGPYRVPRVGILRVWPAAMDGGWSRLVLEKHGYTPEMVGPAEVAAGRLRARFEALLIPDDSSEDLARGPREHALPPEWRGGFGAEARRELRNFVEEGGRVAASGSSVDFAIRTFGLPLRHAAPEAGPVVCPGSLLRSELAGPLGSGPGPILFAPINRVLWPAKPGPAGRTGPPVPLLILPAHDLLWAGHLEGAEHLAGSWAAAEIAQGEGAVTVFAFPPLFRAQTAGTFGALFSAL
jgi:hypothetical protein